MSELEAIAAAARACRARGAPFLLATLVSVEGSSYRRPGARVLLAEDGTTAGGVSGGCLERDLARRGWWRTNDGGAPALMAYEAAGDDDVRERRGSGCGGGVEILLERVDAGSTGDALSFIERCLAEQATAALLTVFRSGRGDVPIGAWLALRAGGTDGPLAPPHPLAAAALAALADVAARGDASCARVVRLAGGVEALVELIQPAPHLLVMGGGLDAVPLVGLARALGWTVTVWPGEARFELRARFAAANRICNGTASEAAALIAAAARPMAVVMSHDLDRDGQALAALLAPPVAEKLLYAGALGPRRRTERLLDERSVPAAARARLHAPAGLALGAETPAEIALAIVAEMQAVLAGAAVGHLRDRAGPIHRAAPAAAPPLRAVGGE